MNGNKNTNNPTCPWKASIMNCRAWGWTHSIHFCTTWFPFWSFTHFNTWPSSSRTMSLWSNKIVTVLKCVRIDLYKTRLTKLSVKRSEISLTITCWSEEMDSRAFWMTLHPYICKARGRTCPRIRVAKASFWSALPNCTKHKNKFYFAHMLHTSLF